MPEHETEEVRIGDKTVELEIVEPLSGGGARVDVEEGDRTWRVDVNGSGQDYDLVTTWRDDTLADLEEPEWLDDVLARLARAV